MRCWSWTLRWKHPPDRECRFLKIDEGERLRWTIVRYKMYVNQAGLKVVKPCCVFSWKFTFVNLLLGLASVSWLAPSRLKATPLTLASVFTPILRLRILRPSHQQKALQARASRRGSLKRWSCTICGMLMLARLVIANRSIYDSWFTLARLVLNAVVFQLDQSDLQTKTGAYSLGKCIKRMVLTHSREFVCVLPLGLLCLIFCFFCFPLVLHVTVCYLQILGWDPLFTLAGFDIGWDYDPL